MMVRVRSESNCLREFCKRKEHDAGGDSKGNEPCSWRGSPLTPLAALRLLMMTLAVPVPWPGEKPDKLSSASASPSSKSKPRSISSQGADRSARDDECTQYLGVQSRCLRLVLCPRRQRELPGPLNVAQGMRRVARAGARQLLVRGG